MWNPIKIIWDEDAQGYWYDLKRSACGLLLFGFFSILAIPVLFCIIAAWIVSLPICLLIWCHKRKVARIKQREESSP